MDLNNDGQIETLLSMGRDRDGKQGNIWTIYEPTSGGYVDVSEMTFSASGFYLGNIDEIKAYGLFKFGPAGGGEGVLSAYLFDGHNARAVQIASVTRDPKTGELRGQSIVNKYMQKSIVGDTIIKSLDINELAREYGITVDPRTYQQVVEGWYREQQSGADALSGVATPHTTPRSEPAMTPAGPETPAPTDHASPAEPVSSKFGFRNSMWISVGFALLSVVAATLILSRRR